MSYLSTSKSWLYRFLLLALLHGGIINSSKALIQETSNELHGSNISYPASFVLVDPGYQVMTTYPNTWSGIFTNVDVVNKVRLIAQEDLSYSGDAYKAEVIFDISYRIDPKKGLVVITDTLTVTYDPDNIKVTKDIDEVHISGGSWASISITSVTVTNLDIGGSVSPVPANLVFRGSIFAERYYKIFQGPFGPATTVSGLSSAYQNLDASGKSDEILISWNVKQEAEEYDVEWTYVNDYDIDGAEIAIAQLSYDFKKNSTRVTTKQNYYSIPIIYERGYLVYRVRPVGRGGSDFTQPIPGSWTSSDNGALSSADYKYTIDSYTSSSSDPAEWGHEADKNWQYIANYAEEGKRKESISYFDGSLRNRQSLSKLNTEDEVLVGETVYDFQGRPAIEVLPAPADEDVFKYYELFNRDASAGEFTKADFDYEDTTSSCVLGTTPSMSSSYGASKYYSSNNTDQTRWNAYLPDAEGYPFTQVEYEPDNTGRIRRQSGVGKAHQLENGQAASEDHETKYLYGKPLQTELDRLFGSEVGRAGHYKKNAVIDANQQVTVSYLDQQGRVIATAISGDNPDNLDALEDSGTPLKTSSNMTINSELLSKDKVDDVDDQQDDNTRSLDKLALEFNQKLIVPIDNVYTFSYKVKPQTFSDACMGNNCFDGIYNIDVDIVDECGNTVSGFTTINDTIGDDPVVDDTYAYSCQNTPSSFTSELLDASGRAPSLTVGSYYLHKKLSVNEEAMEWYAQQYLDTGQVQGCFETYQDILDNEVAKLDFTQCDPIDCKACITSLGDSVDYADLNGNMSIESGTKEEDLAYEWVSLVAQCNKLCSYQSVCDIRYDMLLEDVSPGGQYALYDQSTYSASAYPLSVLNSSNYLPKGFVTGYTGFWQNPYNGYYVDEFGRKDSVYVYQTSSGSYKPELITSPHVHNGKAPIHELKNLKDFILRWKLSYATSLVQYHPEYPYYLSCKEYDIETLTVNGNDYTSDGYDSLLNYSDLDSILNALYASPPTIANCTLSTVISDLVSNDPYFDNNFNTVLQSRLDATYASSDWNATDRSSELSWINDRSSRMSTMLTSNYNNTYNTSIPSFIGAQDIALGMVLCGASVANNCNWTLAGRQGGMSDQQKKDWWSKFRDLYLSSKQQIQEEIEVKLAVHNDAYNGCIGDASFNVFENSDFNTFGITKSTSKYEQQTSMFSSSIRTHWYNSPVCTYGCPSQRPDMCNWIHIKYYKDKIARFTQLQKQLNKSYSVSINPPSQSSSQSGSAGYQIYQNTLMCPLLGDLMGLMNEVNDKKDLSSSLNFWLNDTANMSDNIHAFSFNFIDEINGTSGVADKCKWNSSVGGTGNRTLTIDFLMSNGTSSQCTTQFVFPSSSSFSWASDTVLQFMNFKYVNESPAGTFNLTGKVQVYNGGDPQCVDITGSTCLSIGGCSFGDTCISNQMADDLANLLSILNTNGDISAKSGLESDTTYMGALNPNTFGSYLDLTQSIDWGGGAPYTLTDGTGQYEITFAFTLPSTFNVIWIRPNPNTGSSDNAYIYYYDGSNFQLDSALIQFNTGASTSNLDIGSCGAPPSSNCNTDEHYLRGDLEDFLNELLSQGDIFDSSGVSVKYYSSISNRMKSYSKLYSDIDYVFTDNASGRDELKLYKGEDYCTIYLDQPSSCTWGSITQFHTLRAANVTPQQNGKIFDFTVVVTCPDAEEILTGTSCFPLDNCTDCEDSAMVNMVVNADFESYTTSPTGEDQFNGYVDNWTKAGGSPDYYVGSSADTACNGTAVAGIMLFDGDNANTRDYIQVTMSDTLTAGHTYEVSMSIRRNDDELSGSYAPVGVTEIGAYFTNSSITPSGSGVLSYTPQAVFENTSGLASTYACNRITTNFVATGDETVIVIGNFNADTSTVLFPAVTDTSGLMAYYYIDSVEVIDVDCSRGFLADMPCPDTAYYTDPCDSMLMDIARSNAQMLYAYYADSIKADFKSRYIDQIMDSVVESFTMNFDDNEYHYTLYYYDQAGNLVRTVPPEGVTRITASADLDSVASYRQTGNSAAFTPTTHSYVTTYTYNTLNQLVQQETPDHDDVTKFWYDRLGRLVASQNAKQLAGSSSGDTVYSYTLYDDLGRITEVGEVLTNNDGIYSHITNGVLSDAGFSSMISSGTKTQVTSTYYDAALNSTVEGYFPGSSQDNLRNRVASVTFEEDDDADDDTYDYGTHYSYDIHGNVKTLIQEQQNFVQGFDNTVRIDYEYDLVSGNVNEVHFEPGELGEFYHKYKYDADNRITKVYTSGDGYVWDRDANYQYYKHGPLARVTIGDHHVQAQDFVYTLHGWIKGVNSNILGSNTDPGHDGYYGITNPDRYTARDVMGYSLHYYDNDTYFSDYSSIASISSGDYFIADQSSGDMINSANSKELYNGNIARMVTSIRDANPSGDFRDPKPQGTAYLYDQLNRITSMKAYRDNNLVTNNYWSSGGNDNSYQTAYTYDQNGNITGLNRNKDYSSPGTSMDTLTYHYISGTNKLEYVDDAVPSSNTTVDIDDQASGNYAYDEIGNLTSDYFEDIDTIAWNVYGKITRVIHDPDSASSDILFAYDGNGNRVMKTVIPLSSGARANQIDWTHYVYARDASGNIMGIYTITYGSSGAGKSYRYLTLKEVNLFGSSRLGMKEVDSLVYKGEFSYTGYGSDGRFAGVSEIQTFNLSTNADQSGRRLDDKRYELSNHLGNVLAVVSDKKLQNTDYTSVIEDNLVDDDGTRFGGSFPQGSPCTGCSDYDGNAALSYTSASDEIHVVADPAEQLYVTFPTCSLCYYNVSVRTSQFTGLQVKVDNNGGTIIATENVTSGVTNLTFQADGTGGNHKLRFYNSDCCTQYSFDVDYISISKDEEPYLANMIQTSDYYPFGMVMPGREHTGPENYRYGFNGQEKDDEVKGENNSLAFKYRIHDPRLGRFLSTDPRMKFFPGWTPYQFAGNSPIAAMDMEGLEPTVNFDYNVEEYARIKALQSQPSLTSAELNLISSEWSQTVTGQSDMKGYEFKACSDCGNQNGKVDNSSNYGANESIRVKVKMKTDNEIAEMTRIVISESTGLPVEKVDQDVTFNKDKIVAATGKNKTTSIPKDEPKKFKGTYVEPGNKIEIDKSIIGMMADGTGVNGRNVQTDKLLEDVRDIANAIISNSDNINSVSISITNTTTKWQQSNYDQRTNWRVITPRELKKALRDLGVPSNIDLNIQGDFIEDKTGKKQKTVITIE